MMSKSRFLTLGVVVAALTVGSGVIHGRITERWSSDVGGEEAGQRLETIPEEFGGWKCVETKELTETELGILECDGYIYRVYEEASTGDRVKIVVLVGPSGPTSVHTPEVCYPSRSFQQEGRRVELYLDDGEGGEDQFWSVLFTRRAGDTDAVLACYAWFADGNWLAPDRPRYELLGYPYLYKMQLTMTASLYSLDTPEETSKRFLERFARAVKPHLVPSSRSTVISSIVRSIWN